GRRPLSRGRGGPHPGRGARKIFADAFFLVGAHSGHAGVSVQGRKGVSRSRGSSLVVRYEEHGEERSLPEIGAEVSRARRQPQQFRAVQGAEGAGGGVGQQTADWMGGVRFDGLPVVHQSQQILSQIAQVSGHCCCTRIDSTPMPMTSTIPENLRRFQDVKVLVSSFTCKANGKSETYVGYKWLEQIARFCDTTLVTTDDEAVSDQWKKVQTWRQRTFKNKLLRRINGEVSFDYFSFNR